MRKVSLVGMALVVGGCQFDRPDYDGTAYACATDNTCPPGFVCQDGHCTDDPVDGGAGSDATTLSATDAGVSDDGEVITQRFSVAIDTVLREDSPTSNGGGNNFLEVDADPWRVTVMRFDVTEIPPGATVLAASIDTYVFDPIETGAFQVFPLTESWSEGDATYVLRQGTLLWASPGAAAPSRDESQLLAELEARAIGLNTFILDRDGVQAWIASPAQNKGLVIVSTSTDGRGGQFRSGEYTVADERPYLDVTYRVP